MERATATQVRTTPIKEQEYLRPYGQYPSQWCPGCGIGIVAGAITRAVDSLGIDKNKVAMVSGIGCSGRMPAYLDFDGLHTTHGRALAYATGLKLARPELTVLVVMGDGDALAIGGNHFIHAARRNLDLTAIVVNNFNYGLTSGQSSPTTPKGSRTSNAPYGHIEPPFDVAKLAEGAGASFVARATVYHAVDMEKLIARGIQKKGFSLVEVMSNCHVYYGRYNGMRLAVDMLKWYKDTTAPVTARGGKATEGKMLRGVFVDRDDMPEYYEEYQKLIARAQGGGRSDG